MTNYFNDKGECIDCSGLAKHCRKTGQVFPLMYRESLPGETLDDICDPLPAIYIRECGVDSAAFTFDTAQNNWVEDNTVDKNKNAYVGINSPSPFYRD